MSNIIWRYWQDKAKLLIDRLDGTYAERIEAYPPVKLLTDNDGNNARLRVDVGQTGFFAGRECYTFYKFSIETASSVVIKIVSTQDTILQIFGASLNVASLDIELMQGGTEGGTFSNSLPIFRTNEMSEAPSYTPTTTMALGGTHNGGTMLNVLQLRAGTPAEQAVEIAASNELPFGFSAGNYYIRLVNVDKATATGVFRARWEERV